MKNKNIKTFENFNAKSSLNWWDDKSLYGKVIEISKEEQQKMIDSVGMVITYAESRIK